MPTLNNFKLRLPYYNYLLEQAQLDGISPDRVMEQALAVYQLYKEGVLERKREVTKYLPDPEKLL